MTSSPWGASPPPPSPDLGRLLQLHPELRMERDEYDFNVVSTFGEPLDAGTALARYARHDGAGKPAHLYFHLPLCSYVCHFCNYVKSRLRDDEHKNETLARWTTALIRESELYLEHAPWLEQARIESVYFGGGTASLLREDHLRRLMDHIRRRYSLSGDCEITLEGNPDNFQGDELATARGLGFNRFSVGVQALDDRVTRFTGRGHDAEMSLGALKRLLATGRPFNVDIIYGLPHQTLETVTRDLSTLAELEVPQVTIYRLRNADRVKRGLGIANRAAWNVPRVRERLEQRHLFPGLEETYRMRGAAVQVLLENDYWPAPAAWWSRRGTYPTGIAAVSKNKWQRMDSMIAFGPGAYGWLTGGSAEILQTHNGTDIAAHLQHMETQDTLPLSHGRWIAGREAAAVALAYNFKANMPLSPDRYRRQFGIEIETDEPYRSALEALCAKGLLERDPASGTLDPTLDGEALFEEIVSVYFHRWIGRGEVPASRRATA